MPKVCTNLYILRHGEVDSQWRNRVYGCLDVELSSVGEAEAAHGVNMLAGLRLDAVLTSPLARARHTAELLARPRGLVPCADAGLVELDRGDWAGLSFDELEARAPGALKAWNAAPDLVRPPRGESLNDLQERVFSALGRSIDRHSHRQVAVAAHGWVARVVLCAALKLDLARADRLRMRTGCVSAVRWDGERPIEFLGCDLDGPLPE